MADYTLSNGREITFALDKMSVREYRGLFSTKQSLDEENEVVARVCGLSLDEYLDMPYQEWRRLLVALIKKAREPIDPN